MMKHISAKTRYILFFLLLFLTFSCILSYPSVNATSTEDVDRIYDYASSLKASEEEDLETLAEEYYKETGNNYLIVTTTTLAEFEYEEGFSSEKNCELYSKAFYDMFVSNYGEKYKNCIILTIDLSENRYANITSQNELKTKLDNERRILALKKFQPMLSKGNYYDAYEKYMNTVNHYQKIKPGINADNIFLKTWFQLILALAIGGITITIMIYNSGGKITVTGQTYFDKEGSRTVSKHDHYTHTRTTRTKRETRNNNSSGGSGGDSDNNSGMHF